MRHIAVVSSVLVLCVSLAGQQWQRLPASAHPPKDAFVAMARDANRDRIVCVADEVVGGGPFSVIGRVTTWEWDGARWLQRTTSTTPTAFGMPIAMAWDATRGRTVLVNRGGETWSFDGVDWQQEAITGPYTAFPSLAFDAVRGVLVLATGSGQDDLYEVVNGVWTVRASFAPAQEGTVVGFDALSGRVIAFGGANYSGPGALDVDTTWAWDGTNLTVLSPATVPNGRSAHVLVEDATTGLLLLIGGTRFQSPYGTLAEVHAWNGADWVAQPPLPVPRRYAAAAPLGGFVWLFGGAMDLGPAQSTVYSHELMRRDVAGAWTTTAQPVSGALAAHDTVRARTVSVRNGRTLEFDGYRWSDVGIAFPAASGVAAIAFHAQSTLTVALDGAGNTWLYDGVAWTQASTVLAPPPRTGAGTAYDANRSVVVLAGGIGAAGALGDVWEWNGSSWSNPQPPASPPAGQMVMAWDGASVVAFRWGGSPPTTWSWNGAAWTQLAGSSVFLASPSMAHDPALGLVMFGTFPGPYAPDATYQFTGSTWQYLAAVGNADVRVPAGPLVFDGNRGQLVLHDAAHERDFILSAWPTTGWSYGWGCSGTALVPRLEVALPLHLGTAAVSDVDRATANSFAFLLGDLAQAGVPLPGGCTALLPNPIVLGGAPTNGAGFASLTFAVPPAPSLRGIDVFEQVLVLDAAGALLGFANLTNGVQLRVGD